MGYPVVFSQSSQWKPSLYRQHTCMLGILKFKHSDLCLLCQTSMISKAFLLNVCCSKYKSNMLFKKPHGCNNLQMNMESVDTTLLESRIKMYGRANLFYLQKRWMKVQVCQNLKTLLSVSCHNYPPCFQSFLGPENWQHKNISFPTRLVNW